MAYQDSRQYINAYSQRQERQAPLHRNPNIIVQIPKAPINDFQKSNHAAYGSNQGHAVPNAPNSGSSNIAMYSRSSNIRQAPQHNLAVIPPPYRLDSTTSQTISNVKNIPLAAPAPAASLASASLPPIDYQLLLLSLAEDYLAAAHEQGSLVALHQRKDELSQYYKLIATSLGCLETVLKVGWFFVSMIAEGT